MFRSRMVLMTVTVRDDRAVDVGLRGGRVADHTVAENPRRTDLQLRGGVHGEGAAGAAFAVTR
jgi:hypothetical protein